MKQKQAIDRIRLASEMSETYYGQPLVITYSGGKDSEVLLDLALKSKCRIEVVNSHTTVDAPQTVYHIRKRFKELEVVGIETKILMPDRTMWQLIANNSMPPTRLARYCCKVLKEQSIPNRFIATGVRWSESESRKQTWSVFEVRGKTKALAKMFTFEHSNEVFQDALRVSKELEQDAKEENSYDCTLISNAKKNNDLIVNPIVDWTDSDIWNYINKNSIEVNPLYEMGYERVGCIGCPFAGKHTRQKQFKDFPKYRSLYILSMDRMIQRRKDRGLKTIWENGEDCFRWWIEDKSDPNQMTIDDFMES